LIPTHCTRIIQWITDNVVLPVPKDTAVKKEDTIEILCNNRPLPTDINLATVLQQYWRASNKTLILEFKVM
jgi:hypothetical protein